MTRALLAAGIRVAGVDRDREPLEALAASAREQGKGSELLTLQTDLSKDSAAEEITGATRDRFGPVDILVNNAGIGPGAIRPDSWQRPLKFWEITPDQWRRFVAVHTTAPLALANAHLRAVHQTLASGRAVTTKLPILTVVQRIPSGPNGIQRIPAESPANDAPSLASCNWRIPTGGSPAQ
jgi:NAD(P)-dependent dehydrogenase (short-subunit alcohol dehydrogenase family)